MNWNDFARFYDWEFALLCTHQQQDVKLWQSLAKLYGGPVLELCCGSGRITEKLAEMNLEITALDNSKRMLKILENKKLQSVQTVYSDMMDFHLAKKFKFVFISYASFQQLLSHKEQIHCLTTIKQHLSSDGVLALDINPRICEGPDILEKEISYIADYPLNNSRVTMFTSHKIDRINQIKHWEDTYVEIDSAGKRREFINRISLKECSLDYLKLLFEKCGYEIINVFGDFEMGEITENSENVIWVVR